MPENPNHYDNPLISRYASPEMSGLWSPQRKFSTWRRLWVALAEAEAELGLPISRQQIDELRAHVDDIDFAAAARYERKLRHDVMAHVHTYGDLCPEARPIIHLGATSCYVTDNTDLLLLREGLQMLAGRLAAVIDALATFAAKYRDVPCLGFTHLQPAQPTTVGKRACLWAYDFVMDLAEIEHRITSLKALGSKGTTGTQASFLELFHGDHAKVRRLEELICRKIGFDAAYAVSGQTYSRKIDAQVLGVLSGMAQSATRWPPICGCWPIARRSRNRSKRSRSARRRWRTSGIRCGASGFAHWPGSSRRWSRVPPRRPPCSGWNGRWTTAPTAA